MKLRSIFALVALAAVSPSFALESQVCGVMKVPSTSANTIVCVPWVGVQNDASALTIALNELLAKCTLTEGDSVYYYAPNGTYYRWQYTNGAWAPSATTLSDAQGGSTTIQAPDALLQIPRGAGLWISRQNPATEEIWLCGKFDATAMTSTVAAGSASAPAYSIIANPNAEAYDLNTHGVAGSAGDQILLSDGVTTYTFGTQWTKKVQVTKPYGTTTKQSAEGVTIPAGQGAWYISKGGAPTIQW